MSYVSEPIAGASQAAKLCGALSISIFVVIWLCLEMGWADRPPQYPIWLGTKLVLFGILAIFFMLPGALLCLFGHWLGSGKLWAFYPIIVLAIVDLDKFLMGFCSFWLILPTLILVARLINAWPQVRLHSRGRPMRQTRGFDVLGVQPRKPIVPPPPARGRFR